MFLVVAFVVSVTHRLTSTWCFAVHWVFWVWFRLVGFRFGHRPSFGKIDGVCATLTIHALPCAHREVVCLVLQIHSSSQGLLLSHGGIYVSTLVRCICCPTYVSSDMLRGGIHKYSVRVLRVNPLHLGELRALENWDHMGSVVLERVLSYCLTPPFSLCAGGFR
jgi:hypothetical protein